MVNEFSPKKSSTSRSLEHNFMIFLIVELFVVVCGFTLFSFDDDFAKFFFVTLPNIIWFVVVTFKDLLRKSR